ncbi:MAG: hypothetical protein K9K67_14150 [Bacteriovoracaceae bacterium]|nr:hypothetical protein [Bacteriovoracaceae bacterium]
MKGGRRDQFFFCLIEHFEEDNRWFLRSLLQVKDEDGLSGDEAIRTWIEKFKVKQMVLDFPLSQPACATCLLDCPGSHNCPEPSVLEVRKKMQEILDQDELLREENPKKYEQDRNFEDLFDYGRNLDSTPATNYMLSRSFKRRLKKGFIPYWNRALDFWVWCHYYNQILEIFNLSFDSFGSTSLMVQSRFSYLRRHFPEHLRLFEANGSIVLIELLRAGIILKKDLHDLADIEFGVDARIDIIRKIEKGLNIFIYDHDFELLVRNPRAFDSFLLAIAGQNKLMKLNSELPLWTRPQEVNFISPIFHAST